MRPIKMVDLHNQYLDIRNDVDAAIQKVLDSTDFIQGDAVKQFEKNLSTYQEGAHVITCGNGTDALQIAMMAIDCKSGDEIIIPVFTYVATAEVIALLNLIPVFADVDPETFTIDIEQVERLITKKTRAIVPVHLFGQCADMSALLELGKKHNLHIVEDAAQSLGAEYIFADGKRKKAGTMGIINTTSFFPSKNLGAYGDGGAIFTLQADLAEKIRIIANHGQKKKYYHDVVGVNSRLDTLQAAILDVKLKSLGRYAEKRRDVADYYDRELSGVSFLKLPTRNKNSTHVFHQYTVTTLGIDREKLRAQLQAKGIPSNVFYPLPLHLQKAYQKESFGKGSFPVSEKLSGSVLSLPIHTEMDEEQLSYICGAIKAFS